MRGKSFDLDLRLANVVAHRMNTENNPLIPDVMCRMLWETITEHSNSHSVQRCLNEVITTRVVPLLSDLYNDVDATLDKQDVFRAREHALLEEATRWPGKRKACNCK